MDFIDVICRKSICRIVLRESFVFEANYSTGFCPEPDATIWVFLDAYDMAIRQPVFRREGGELAAFISHQPGLASRLVRADPECASVIHEQNSDTTGFHLLRITRVKYRESNTVEANETVPGPHPKITFGSPRKRNY